MKYHLSLSFVILFLALFSNTYFVFGQSTIRDWVGLSLSETKPLIIDSIEENSIDLQLIEENVVLSNRGVSPLLVSANIDTSKDVGEIACDYDVQQGAFIIDVPIEVYQNPIGLTPQISLNYNSMFSSVGSLGWGWNLEGGSVVHRTNKSQYYDGETAGITFATPDVAYSLDGERLILLEKKSSEYIYQTEQGFVKVRGAISGTNMADFHAFYPDGKQAIYDLTDRHSFYITQLTDKTGSSVKYYYTPVKGHYRLSHITYGANQQASVVFEYVTRTDNVQTLFIDGTKIVYDYLLSSIKTYVNNTLLRTYNISYLPNTLVPTISQLDCIAGGKVLNPLKFAVESNEESTNVRTEYSQLYNWYRYEDSNAVRTIKGKFKYGSEDDDIAMLPNKIQYYEASSSSIGNQYDGSEPIYVATGLGRSGVAHSYEIVTGKGFVDAFCINLDDTRGEKLVTVNNSVVNGRDLLVFNVYGINSFAAFPKEDTWTVDFGEALRKGSNANVSPKQFYTGDFNGDGRMEVLVVSSYNALGLGKQSKVCVYDLSTKKKLYDASPFQYTMLLPQKEGRTTEEAYKKSDWLYALDYDGDGKTDLFNVKAAGGADMYRFRTNGAALVLEKVTSESLLFADMQIKERDLYWGEFNGDGKNDFLLSPLKGGTDWKIYSSLGNGKWNVQNISLVTNSDSSQFLLQDINGDGQSDLVEIRETDSESTLHIYFISNWFLRGSCYTDIPKGSIVIPSNVQSRNFYNNLVCLRSDGKVHRIYPEKDEAKKRLTKGFCNSLGIVTSVDYKALNDDVEPVYGWLPNSDVEFPYQNYNGGLLVCSNLKVKAPLTGIGTQMSVLNDIDFQYSSAVIHKQGLGFMGFSQIHKMDGVTNKSETTTFAPVNFGVLVSNVSTQETDTYEYDVQTDDNKISLITLTKSVSLNKSNNQTTTTTYTYDTYGNVKSKTVDYGDGLNMREDNSYQYVDTDAKYLLNLLREKVVVTNRYGKSHNERTRLAYNSQYLISSKEFFTNGLRRVRAEVYSYDAKNRLKNVQSKFYNSTTAQITTFEYNDNGQLLSKREPSGLLENYSYNKMGLLSRGSKQGKIREYIYDDWGRIVENSYGNARTKTTWNWDNSGTGVYVVTEESDSKPTVKTYFDGLNREVKKSEMCFDGTYVHSTIEYDALGRVVKETVPNKSGAAAWTSYEYDAFDRPVKIVYHPTGRTETYAYNGLSTTTVIDGVTTKRTYNAMGDLLEVQDASGTITYDYDADGQPSSISLPGNLKTTFEYDYYRRQTKLNDPSAGSISFTYDANGNLSTQTDANGNVVRMVYDQYNRLQSREYDGLLTTTYAYNANNYILSEESSNGHSKTYTYDSDNRLFVEEETIPDGKKLKKIYNYYTNDNLRLIAYYANDEFVGTELYSYANGRLVDISFGSFIFFIPPGLSVNTVAQSSDTIKIWRADAVNDAGLLSRYFTGGLRHMNTYDVDGRLTGQAVNLGTIRRKLTEYGYDVATGNLVKRKDGLRNKEELFIYDNQNRLSSFAGKTVTYDNKGNITYMDGVGSMEYDGYAVTKLIPDAGTSQPSHTQSVTYNAMNRPETISEGIYRAAFTYGGNAERLKMTLSQYSLEILSRYYIGGNYELDVAGNSSKEKLYLGGDAYSAPAVAVRENGEDWVVYYIVRDHLGSITHLFDSNGALKQELSFDAWGNLRNPATHKVYSRGTEPELILGRGFTGHEHLTQFGLINMNARLYDPLLGRFLSPDRFVQNIFDLQNYNRYSYCGNSPLCYVDKDGNFYWIIAGIIVGAYIGASVKEKSLNPAKWSSDWWKGALIGGTVGAFGGGLAGAIVKSGSFSFSVIVNYKGLGLSLFKLETAHVVGTAANHLIFSAFGYTLGKINKSNGNLSQQEGSSVEQSSDDGDYKETVAQIVDNGSAMTAENYYSKNTQTWMGRNLNRYSTEWGGNQYTGGRVQYAWKRHKIFKAISKRASQSGTFLTWYNVGQGKTDFSSALLDTGVGFTFSLLNPYVGAWATLWYEAGKEW